jgi:hypothetical protein
MSFGNCEDIRDETSDILNCNKKLEHAIDEIFVSRKLEVGKTHISYFQHLIILIYLVLRPYPLRAFAKNAWFILALCLACLPPLIV